MKKSSAFKFHCRAVNDMNYLYIIWWLAELDFFVVVVVTLPKYVCMESRGNNDSVEGIGHGLLK